MEDEVVEEHPGDPDGQGRALESDKERAGPRLGEEVVHQNEGKGLCSHQAIVEDQSVARVATFDVVKCEKLDHSNNDVVIDPKQFYDDLSPFWGGASIPISIFFPLFLALGTGIFPQHRPLHTYPKPQTHPTCLLYTSPSPRDS